MSVVRYANFRGPVESLHAHPSAFSGITKLREGSTECKWNPVLYLTDRDGSTRFFAELRVNTGRCLNVHIEVAYIYPSHVSDLEMDKYFRSRRAYMYMCTLRYQAAS